MTKFEFVNRFSDNAPCNLPVRKTIGSAGYDFEVAEDIVIPSYQSYVDKWNNNVSSAETKTLEETANLMKIAKTRPTLVPTGVKCKLDPGTYLELSVRSSCPLKYWLVLANGVGIIDADYYGNPDNDGEIFFQMINMTTFPIQLHKGDIIGQGIIKRYGLTEDDSAIATRMGGFGSTSNA